LDVAVKGAQTTFAEENWLLTWTHELKSRREAWHLSYILHLSFLWAILYSYLAATLESRNDRNDWITSLWQGTPNSRLCFGWTIYLAPDNSRTSPRNLCLRQWPTRTHLWLGLFNYAYVCPCPQIFCLLKPMTHVCTQKMSWVLPLPLPKACIESYNKSLSAFTTSLYFFFEGQVASPGIWNLRSLGLGSKTSVF
jgi:hypothetical protein